MAYFTRRVLRSWHTDAVRCGLTQRATATVKWGVGGGRIHSKESIIIRPNHEKNKNKKKKQNHHSSPISLSHERERRRDLMAPERFSSRGKKKKERKGIKERKHTNGISKLAHISHQWKVPPWRSGELHRPGRPPKKDAASIRFKSPLYGETLTCHLQTPGEKKKKKKKNTALDQNVRAMIHLFRYQYLQFHHVCTARRGNSLPWLHPMAHRAFFPRPAAPSQYACVCSPTCSNPERRVNHHGRLWHRFTVRVLYPAWRVRKPDWTSCVMSVYIRERERSAEIKGHHVVFGEGIQAQNGLTVRAAVLTRK